MKINNIFYIISDKSIINGYNRQGCIIIEYKVEWIMIENIGWIREIM